MNLEELREKIGDRELENKKVEGLIATIFKDFRVESTIASFRVMYSYLLSYGYFEKEEADEVFEAIVENYSTYELSEFSKSVAGSGVVDYYEKLLEIEHMTSLHPVVNNLEDSLGNLDVLLEDYEVISAQLEYLMKGEEEA